MKTFDISPALAAYEPYYERILKTGSRVICDPIPSESSDEDYLVLVTPSQRHDLEILLRADGWNLGGSLPNPISLDLNSDSEEWLLNTEHTFEDGKISNHRLFHSWKRYETPAVYESIPGQWLQNVVSEAKGPEINLLVTCNEQYFDDFTRATFLSQGLNLQDKGDRVMVFEALTRDSWPTGRKKKKKPTTLFRGLEYHYGDINTQSGQTGFVTPQNEPPMTAMEVIQLQQAMNATNPPIVVHQDGHVETIAPNTFWNNMFSTAGGAS